VKKIKKIKKIKTAIIEIFDEIAKTEAFILRPATDDEIKRCNNALNNIGCIAIPEEYAELLKISNGFSWNGFEFFGTYQVREKSSGYILNDIVSVNESEGFNENILILAACDEDYYVYDAGNKKYRCFDRLIKCDIADFESFVDMIKETVGKRAFD
jgi:hypothetical protein